MSLFDNTRVAFADKSNRDLRKAYWMFVMVKSPLLVKTGAVLLQIAIRLSLPIRWILKPTVFDHFCGGETLQDCIPSLESLSKRNVKAVLDYAAEGVETEKEFDEATERILATVELCRTREDVAFAVFKFTGIARFALLEKQSANEILTAEEQQELERAVNRADEICRKSMEAGISVMIDAEESWIQTAVDDIVERLMEKYNRERQVVFHTLQMYRVDRLYYLKNLFARAMEKGYFPAVKLVRGAYMEKERERAMEKDYASPIHLDKNATDDDFDKAVRFCLMHIDTIALCIGTHNENSCQEAIDFMHVHELDANHPNIHFSQLMGMSDHISNNLAIEGYNVCKYLPYGPLKLVMPYLIRRAEENTSVAGQTGRELELIKKELRRRNKEGL